MEASSEALEWLQHSHSDLLAGTKLKTTSGVLPGVAAFHFQQAIEKALKAVLIAGGVDFPKTHNLPHLVRFIRALGMTSLPPSSNHYGRITMYAVETRYPNYGESITSEELEDAEAIASEAFKWASSVVGSV